MPPSFNIEARHRTQLTRLTGSFWTTIFSDQKAVRTFLGMSRLNKSPGDLFSSMRNLAGDQSAAAEVTFAEIKFKPCELIESGMEFYQDPERSGLQYGGAHSSARVYSRHRTRYYGLPLTNIVPTAIQSKAGKLLSGVDFFISGDYLFFRKDPRIIFADNRYIVERGTNRNHRSYLSFLTRTPVRDNEDLVVQYLRRFQTPLYFRLMLSAVAGMRILRSEQRLLEVHKVSNETVYCFENETVRVDYKHEPLEVGKVYPNLHVIGEGVRVYFNDGSGRAWWREVDWRGGLILSPFTEDAEGLKALDREVPAYPAGEDFDSIDGSKLHARIRLSDDYDREKRYWEDVASRETRSGRYLNSQLQLPREPQGVPGVLDTFTKMENAYVQANELNRKLKIQKEYPEFSALPTAKQVNALDTLFQAVLGETAMVVLIDLNRIRFASEVFAVLNREMPTGCTPIVFCYGPDLTIETMDFDYTIDAVASRLRHSIETPIVLNEVVDLSQVMADFVEIKIETPL